ncbi:MAG: hypothetical protein SFV15_11140 [Polyangiaceae bacterium]|nr:hypothetical protein [Polyangiaceae bacterium]
MNEAFVVYGRGHIGIGHYVYQRYFDFPKDVRWVLGRYRRSGCLWGGFDEAGLKA